MAPPTENKQWLSKLDGLDKLFQNTAKVPSPGQGEVLVKIQAVALNYRDTEVCMGLYNHHKTTGGDENPSLVPT